MVRREGSFPLWTWRVLHWRKKLKSEITAPTAGLGDGGDSMLTGLWLNAVDAATDAWATPRSLSASAS